MQPHTCTNTPPCWNAGAGTISATSLSHSALCSSHFPPVSDPLPLLHFNPPPVPPLSWQGSEQRERGGEREREQGRGGCTLWVAKRLPLERSNPLHHTSLNLLCSSITLWEPVSAFYARLAPPLLFPSSPLIRLFLLHLWLPLLSLIPPTSKPFNSCLWISMLALSLLLGYLGGTRKYTANRNQVFKTDEWWERICIWTTCIFILYVFVCQSISQVCVSICCELLQEPLLPVLSGWVECWLLQQQSQSPLPTA